MELTVKPCYAILRGPCNANDVDPGQRGPAEVFELVKGVLDRDLSDFSSFFKGATGGLEPWGAQRAWIRRLLAGEHVVLIAPTGIGKTTLLLAYALYSARLGKRALYIAPTRALALQIYRRIAEFSRRAGLEGLPISFYDSGQSAKKRSEVLERIGRGEYGVLVITGHFLVKHIEKLLASPPSLIIADDADSLVKSDKSIKRLIALMGFGEDIIELAKRRMQVLWKIIYSRAMNGDPGELVKEYLSLDMEIEKRISSTRRTQVVIASATGRMKGSMGKVLRELLRIDISGITIYGRDITDTYLLLSGEGPGEVISLVRRLGPGGIIYISPRHPMKGLFERIAEGIRAESGLRAGEATPSNVFRMAKGDLDILIGSASYYGSSVRGIDIPDKVKYVVFLGTPVFSVPLESYLSSINSLMRALIYFVERGDREAGGLLAKLRSISLGLTPGEARLIKLILEGKISGDVIKESDKLYGKFKSIEEIYSWALRRVKEELAASKVMEMGTITLYLDEKGAHAMIPDLMTYIQASGRASRLFNGRMTHGLSIIVEAPPFRNAISGLEARLKMVNRELGFVALSSVSLERELELAARTRDAGPGEPLAYKSALIVVESPTKAKAIARFFGKPVSRRIGNLNVYQIPAKIGNEIIDINVIATRGHIFDLTTSDGVGVFGVFIDPVRVIPVYDTIKRCQICGTQFTHGASCPRCGSTLFTDSKAVVAALSKLAGEVDEVYIATDPDMEGEKIAYDVYEVIKEYNSNIRRIELHEITPQELQRALASPRDIDIKLVEAELFRRILDRWVGFSLSKALQAFYEKGYLGAGRVQAPALSFIVKRYEEYRANTCKKVSIVIGGPYNIRTAFYLDKNDPRLKGIGAARALRLVKKGAQVVKLSPMPPFTTEEYLASASRLGIPSSVAMKIAQELFEAGLITYHRTDSKYVSSTGISVAMKYLEERGLRGLASPNHWGSPGTHEAIRPVHHYDSNGLIKAVAEGLINPVIPLTGLHLKLYDMIHRRFIASQMRGAKLVEAVFEVRVGGEALGELRAYTKVLEKGFNEVLPVKVVGALDGVGDIEVTDFSIEVSTSSRSPLYSEGDVVMLMKKHNIGRPSTYSKIIANLRKHGYVINSKKLLKLIPTKMGIEVDSFLRKEYPELVSVEATRHMEETIDLITKGAISAREALANLYAYLSQLSLVPPLKAYISEEAAVIP